MANQLYLPLKTTWVHFEARWIGNRALTFEIRQYIFKLWKYTGFALNHQVSWHNMTDLAFLAYRSWDNDGQITDKETILKQISISQTGFSEKISSLVSNTNELCSLPIHEEDKLFGCDIIACTRKAKYTLSETVSWLFYYNIISNFQRMTIKPKNFNWKFE